MTRIISLLLVYLLIGGNLTAQSNRIEFNGKELFLSGANIPWIDFANDVGNMNNPPDTAKFREIFREVHDNGGNSMRFWVHINGQSSPEFTGNLVTGPGERSIPDLDNICNMAYSNDIGLVLCLWSFDMQRINGNLSAEVLERNKHILTTDEGLGSYIENALVPMVDSMKGHPGILAWEIFNEPEGMTEVGAWSNTQHVSQLDVQKFVNRCAGAIHRTDTTARVTNGSWSFIAASDVGDGTNYYRDDRLIAAGGDDDGTLDFYTVHYYDWDDKSPFVKPYSHWELDKPMVVAEFFPNCKKCGREGENYDTLYQNGYAGAWAWSYTGTERQDILKELQRTFDAYGGDIMVSEPHLPYLPSAIITSPESRTVFDRGDTVAIEVYSKKYNGTVAKVEFFADEVKLGEDIEEPFAYQWTGAPDGEYKIKVISTDDQGHMKTSCPVQIVMGAPPVFKYEAEEAILEGGTSISSNDFASGGKYVVMTDNDGGSSIEWIIPNCPRDSLYTIAFGYRSSFGYKEQFLYVNDDLITEILVFDAENQVDWFEESVEVNLNEGENRIKIVSSWGWMDFDYLRIPFAKPVVIHISPEGWDPGNEADGVSIYPNPSGGVLYISGSGLLQEVEIYTMAGLKVLDKTVDSFETEINLSSLPGGVYLLQVADERGMTTVRRIIKK